MLSAGINHALSALMRTFSADRTKLGSRCDEKLDRTLDMLDSIAAAWGLPPSQKRMGLIFMFEGHSAHFFKAQGRNCNSLKEEVLLLRKRYNRSDKRHGMLTCWENLRLSEGMQKRQGCSQKEVFLDFTAQLMELQKQLNIHYHANRFTRDQFFDGHLQPLCENNAAKQNPSYFRTADEQNRKKYFGGERYRRDSIGKYLDSIRQPRC